MAVDYDNWSIFGRIFTCDGGVFSGDLRYSIAFDIYPDDAEINDAIYFYLSGDNDPGRVFSGIKVNVGTAFAATSVTFVWEYWNGSAWAELTVDDGTANWTNIGQNVIAFTPPDDWRWTTVNGAAGIWVRNRITAIDTPTEGGATQSYIYGRLNWAIVTGGSTETPINFGDIAAALDEYGIVTWDEENRGYSFNCDIDFGDGSTGCVFAARTSSYRPAMVTMGQMRVNADCTFTTGMPIEQVGLFGPNIHLADANYSTWGTGWGCLSFTDATKQKLYGTRIADCRSNGGLSLSNVTARDCFVRGSNIINVSNSELRRVIFESMGSPNGEPATFEDCTMIATQYVLRGGGTMDGVNIVRFTHWLIYAGTNGLGYLNDLNFLTQDPAYTVNPAGATNYNYYGQNRLYLTIQGPQGDPMVGLSVVIEDNNGDPISGSPFTTNGDGLVVDGVGDVPLILYKHLFEAGAGDESVTYEYHTVIVTEPGYRTHEVRYVMDRKRVEIETLVPLDITPPTFAGLASATDRQTGGEVALAWSPATDDDTGVECYNIYYHTVDNAAQIVTQGIRQQAPDGAVGAVVGGLTDYETYYFIVRAQDKENPANEDINTVIKFATPTRASFVMEELTGSLTETETLSGTLIETETLIGVLEE